MADRTLQILPGGQSAAPFTYSVPASTSFTLLAVRALFDGSASATSWKPSVKIVSDAGQVMAETIGDTVVAGGSADASFFPRVKRSSTLPVTLTYYQVIAALSSTNSLVAQWHLTEGAEPYADTSGNTVGGNAQMIRQAIGTAMTQNNPAGPLTASPAGPSVAFNFDGHANPPGGDYLHTGLAPPSRFAFLGNLPYSVVAWVKPVAGANNVPGGVIGNVKITNPGLPGSHVDGWRIGLKASSLECTFDRYCNMTVDGTQDTVSLGAMSTTQWTMVAGTYDGATLRAYADGFLVGSIASAGAIGDGQDAQISLSQALNSVVPSWYLGAVAEVTVWASTLTDDQIALLYLAGTA